MKTWITVFLSLFLSFSAYAISNKTSVIYFTSWETEDVDLSKLSNKTSFLNLSFAKINDDFSFLATDDILQFNSKNDRRRVPSVAHPYQSWTTYKYKNPDVKILLAFGGATFGDMWLLLNNEENVGKFVNTLLSVVNERYPVYAKVRNNYERVGYVSLDGVDLDFEIAGQRPSDESLKNLAAVISQFKKAAPDKTISLTGFHTAADPAICQNVGTKKQGCSFPPGSVHAGELLPLFTNYLNLDDLDFYNLMAYDADVNYDWRTAMANHAKYLPKEKLILGLTLGEQWGEPRFVESQDDLRKKITQQKKLGYAGIMVWAVGAKGGLEESNKQRQVDIINNFIEILNQ